MTKGPSSNGTTHRPARARAVVVSWNGAHLLSDCLDSLLSQTVVADLEIVVVDNASEDGTTALLAERYPSVDIVRSDTNIGFAGGADLGIDGFGGDFIALLNNDATFDADALETMIAVLDQDGNERVAAVTAKILLAGAYELKSAWAGVDARPGSFRRGNGWLVPVDPDRPEAILVVNSTGNVVTRRGTGADRDWLRAEGEESHDPDVFGFCGGAALLRRAALDDVGSFDRDLFLYYEDTDLSWRLRGAGWTVRYCESAIARHRHAASSDSASPMFRYYNTRNSLVVFARHAPTSLVARSLARQVAGCVIAALTHSEPRAVTGARVRGLAAFARRSPTILRERRLWSAARISRSDVARYVSDAPHGA